MVDALAARQEAAVVVYSPGPTPAVLQSWSADGLTVLREGPVEDADLTAARAKAGASVLRIAAPSSRM